MRRHEEAREVLLGAKLALEHLGPEVRYNPELVLAKLDLDAGKFKEARPELERIAREARREGAQETEAAVRLELFYLAALFGDEPAVFSELGRLAELDAIRSFDVQSKVRAVVALRDDHIEGVETALDALDRELEREGATIRAYVRAMKTVRYLMAAWTGELTTAEARDGMAQVLAAVTTFVARQGVPRLVEQTYELRNWFALLEKALSADSRARVEATLADPGSHAIVVSSDFEGIRPPDGEWISLSRKPRTREILRCLVEHRTSNPGSTISAEELFEAAWPDTTIRHDSAMARVYTAISEIRKLGFADVLQKTDAGYLLDPEVDVVRLD